MADIRVVKTGSDTYSIIKDGKTYTAKDVDGDGKLTKADGNSIGLTDNEWADVTQVQVNTSQSRSTSVFTSPYVNSNDLWSYDTMYAGNRISYPTDALSAHNDSMVWKYADGVANMPGMLVPQMNGMMGMLQSIQNSNMQMYMKMIQQMSSTLTGGATATGTSTGTTTNTDEKTKKLEEEIAKLKKEVEESKTVKTFRDDLKDTTSYDSKVTNLVEKLYTKMDGANLSSWFGNIGNDKAVGDALREVNSKNIVEVMDTYKTTICDEGKMRNDYNLVESIYNDFEGEKYSPKITQLMDALVERANALIAKYGDKIALTQQDVTKFKTDVTINKDKGRSFWGDDGSLISHTFEDFKDKLKDAEGSTDVTVVKPTVATTTQTSSSTTTSSTTSSTEKTEEEKKKEEEAKK